MDRDQSRLNGEKKYVKRGSNKKGSKIRISVEKGSCFFCNMRCKRG